MGLVIELDGGHHAERKSYDQGRTEFLNSKGYWVLRFWNSDVLMQTEAVLESIYQSLIHPHPTLSRQAGEENNG